MLREFALKYIMLFVGTFYRWNGADPSGLDCSGLVVEMLKSVGVVERQADYTAEQLYGMFEPFKVNDPGPGVLVFYSNSAGKINHVEICLGHDLTLGSSGGGSKTLTVEDAIKQNAFVKVRPINKTRTIVGYADPFAGMI